MNYVLFARLSKYLATEIMSSVICSCYLLLSQAPKNLYNPGCRIGIIASTWEVVVCSQEICAGAK